MKTRIALVSILFSSMLSVFGGGTNLVDKVSGDGSLLTGINASSISSGTLPAAQLPALTGAITTSAGSAATVLGSFTSAALGTAVPDETGSGALVFGTSPTLTTPLVKLTTSTKTANYSVVATDTGTYFNNSGASGAVTNTLPASAAGLQYSLYVVANQNLAFKAVGSDTIRNAGTVSAAAGLAFSSTIGSAIHIYCPVAGTWIVDSLVGSFTIQ